MSHIQLVALDLDGTLFNNKSIIPPANIEAIRRITGAGVYAVISTGRPLTGLPWDQLEDTGIDYAITTNGGGVYRLSTKECLCDGSMPEETILPILSFLMQKDIHLDAFIDGQGVSPTKCREIGLKLSVPDELKKYIVESRMRVDDLEAYIRTNHLSVQKVTLNFLLNDDGTFRDREEVKAYLESNPNVSCVCGGYHNLEFTRADISKGVGLKRLCEHLGIDIADTMAVGDTENDLSILEAAGVAVAMGNATDAVKELSDYVTSSNEEDGVAHAIMHFLPDLF